MWCQAQHVIEDIVATYAAAWIGAVARRPIGKIIRVSVRGHTERRFPGQHLLLAESGSTNALLTSSQFGFWSSNLTCPPSTAASGDRGTPFSSFPVSGGPGQGWMWPEGALLRVRKGDIATMADDLGTDLDQLLPYHVLRHLSG